MADIGRLFAWSPAHLELLTLHVPYYSWMHAGIATNSFYPTVAVFITAIGRFCAWLPLILHVCGMTCTRGVSVDHLGHTIRWMAMHPPLCYFLALHLIISCADNLASI